LLDEPDVGLVLQHLRRHRMLEQVATADVAQPGRSHVIAHHLCHPVVEKRVHRHRQEQRAVIAGYDPPLIMAPLCSIV
jgi:hypothetical protein